MKYLIEDYEQTEFYEPDEDISNHKQKIVKVRKMHKCAICQKDIQIGEQALRESGFMDREPVSCYTCIPCLDRWFDEINEANEDGEDEYGR